MSIAENGNFNSGTFSSGLSRRRLHSLLEVLPDDPNIG